ncbi:Myb-like domain-containing protein [Dioscorea alata]|uniref:Myb-like domain-containing protein n=3 Tax=Dioscorea alata TaxID=55571 RepID=A0ACB7VEL5_DIOAL|nr:Myb-like domain-containing protein [Dioscorea alata]
MEQTEQPCIVQALPAINAAGMGASSKQNNFKIVHYRRHASRMESQLPCIVQALPAASNKLTPTMQGTTSRKGDGTPTKQGTTSRKDARAPTKQGTTSRKDDGAHTKQGTTSRKGDGAPTKQGTTSQTDDGAPPKWELAIIQAPPSSRYTRSQAAPDWTQQEMLILVNEMAGLEEDWLKSVSSFQRWKIVSDNCAASDVIRSSNQCKRKWELLLADYKKIRKWESHTRGSSYWSLDGKRRKSFGLPAVFDNQVFDSMDAVIKAQEDQMGLSKSDSEGHIATAGVEQQMDVDTDSGSEGETWSKTDEKSTDKAQETASRLEDNAMRIHAILKGEIEGISETSETELARRQAVELIGAFGDLTGTINEFVDLIKAGEFEGIRACKSLTP